MQEANFILSNCFEITFYLSCCKHPPAQELPFYWRNNINSTLAFIGSTHQGVYGLVSDENGKPIKEALVYISIITKIANRTIQAPKTTSGKKDISFDWIEFRKWKAIKVTDDGEYWRLLAHGSYNVSVQSPTSLEVKKEINITEDKPYVRLDITLIRDGLHGLVQDKDGNPIPTAIITVENARGKFRDTLQVSENGEYYTTLSSRIQPMHKITASAPCFIKQSKWVQIPKEPKYIQLDFVLKKKVHVLLNKWFNRH